LIQGHRDRFQCKSAALVETFAQSRSTRLHRK
jgi:hypothetical protein